MTDMEKISMIREAMPVTRNKVYLNTGSVGPLGLICHETLQRSQELELQAGRADMRGMTELKQSMADLRRAVAGLVKARAEEIALTLHTTNGMNIVTYGLAWQAGDEVITTDLEHPGGFLPLYVLRQRCGVTLKVVSIPPNLGPDEVVARFEEAITPRTRLMVFSHVAWNTGMRLPLKEIVAMGHRRHVLSLVDGAQSAGAIPLDLPASGVDFYAISGQKWLCGPEGLGALYVRQDRFSQLAPTFVGYRTFGDKAVYDATGYFMPAPDARRYEFATIYRPGLKAMLANLNWLTETIGWDWIYARIAHLAGYARRALSRLAEVTIITPPGPQAGLVTFILAGYDPARLITRLAEEDIVLRFIDQPYALRISTGFYNTEADIDRLVEALQEILKQGPESLPVYG